MDQDSRYAAMSTEDVTQTYVNSMEDFSIELNGALKGAYPSATQPFEKVYALLLSWDSTDIDIQPTEDHFAWTLEKVYMYKVTRFRIPGNGTSFLASNALKSAIVQFVTTYDGPNTLLIVAYSGHAQGNEHECLWAPTRAAEITVDWLKQRCNLEQVESSVLQILECCFAAVAAMDGRCELLAAASRTEEASGHRRHNFTKAVSLEMRNSGGRPMTVAQLHALISSKVLHQHLPTTPVHVQLGSRVNTDSITLERLGSSTSAPRELSEATADRTPSVRVLVTAKLSNPLLGPSRDQWNRFLSTHRPSNVESLEVAVRAEGFFQSLSFILQLSMPLEVFSLLRRRQAFTFAAYVYSSNLFIEGGMNRPSAPTSSQLIRKENVDPRKKGVEPEESLDSS